MKRILIIVGVVLLVLVVAVGALVAVTFMGRKPIVDGLEVSGARIVADGMVTAAVVPVGPGQVALIDAGNDTDGKALLAELSRRQLGPDAVTVILLTHGHPDHIGAVKKFPGARVMAIEREVGLVEGHEGAKGPATRLFPVSPTGIAVGQALHDGETVRVGNVDVHVYAMPGHTAGSAAYLINGVLFMGDSADATSAGALQGSPWIFSDSQAENRASLVRLASRLKQDGSTVTAIAPAHSGVLMDGTAQLDAYAAGQ